MRKNNIFRNARVRNFRDIGFVVVAWILALSFCCGAGAADPIVDGKVNGAEYTYCHDLWYNLDVDTYLAYYGTICIYQDADGDWYFGFIQSPDMSSDNVYSSTNQSLVEWEPYTGGKHTLGQLIGSDKAKFRLTDSCGNVILDFGMDYISECGEDWCSRGVGGAGGCYMYSVDCEGYLLEEATSMEWNWFNSNFLNYTTRSPYSTDYIVTEIDTNTGDPYTWIFELMYEFKIDGSAFYTNEDPRCWGFAGIDCYEMHNSPFKLSSYDGTPYNLPTASLTHTPSEPTNLDTIQFTDTSTGGDGVVVSWSWDFGDGESSTDQNPQHQYTYTGIYTVKLTVTDDHGANDTTTHEITIDVCDLDLDNDGICDSIDTCPNTPQNCNVGSNGCKIDSDSDGVCNGVDPCPNDQKDCCIATTDTDSDGLQENNANCQNYDNYPNDHDNDGVASSADCDDSDVSNTRAKGDTDNDSIDNCIDPCPNDANNQCQCVDNDDDGLGEGTGCPDQCPNDKDNCCIATTDTDNDGLQENNANCMNYDNYPNDHDNDGVASSADCDDSDVSNTRAKGDTDNDSIDNCIDPCPNDAYNQCQCVDNDDDGLGEGTGCPDQCPNDKDNCCIATTDTDSDGLQENNANCMNYDNYPNDHDNDGVASSADCDDSDVSNTRAKGDTDNDSIDNCIDPCPNDANNQCQCVDNDDDGLGEGTGCPDQCPNDKDNCCIATTDTDSDGLQENNANCMNYDNYPNDHDNDGVASSLDCDDSDVSNTRAKGDTDNDSTDNCIDPCPNDANNQCQCVDNDDDGLGEGTGCPDQCPNDKDNCCIATKDTDNDGLQENNANCMNYDNYPNDHDNDGVASSLDCDDSDVSNIGTTGDTDNDSIDNCIDPCPNDANNQCQCVDNDDDGLGEGTGCPDQCPNDKDNCCIATKDTDNDGLQENNANCQNYDNRPNDHDNDGAASSLDCDDSDLSNTRTKGDSDGDGIDNCIDPCPGDESNSCQCVDNDNDGLGEGTGCPDQCPNDKDNCCIATKDTDNDGLQENNANCLNYDNYPNDHDNDGFNTLMDCDDSDASNTRTKGDSDGDEIDNCIDPCPGDATNSCQCVDHDNDGLGEGTGCPDQCPNDKDNCCIATTDTDNDGLQENNANCQNYDNYPNDHDNDGVITIMDCNDSDANNVKIKEKCNEEQTQIPTVGATGMNGIIMNAMDIANEAIVAAVTTINETKSNLNVSEEVDTEVKEKINEAEDLIESAKEKVTLAESLMNTDPEKAKEEAEDAKELAASAIRLAGEISKKYKTGSSAPQIDYQSEEEGLSLFELVGIACFLILFIVLAAVMKKQR